MNKLYKYDLDLLIKKNIKIIAGFDEAGRGPLAGPVFASGVILKREFQNELINDSKKLTPKKREILFDEIINNSLAYAICSIDASTIDKINILEASRLCMQNCYNKLCEKINIDLVLTDYMNFKTKCELISLVKGDQTSYAIACSSILAKVSRDRYMIDLAKKYPQYGFDTNMGYGTKKHLEAIKKYGIIDNIHRKSYQPVKEIIEEKNKIFLF